MGQEGGNGKSRDDALPEAVGNIGSVVVVVDTSVPALVPVPILPGIGMGKRLSLLGYG